MEMGEFLTDRARGIWISRTGVVYLDAALCFVHGGRGALLFLTEMNEAGSYLGVPWRDDDTEWLLLSHCERVCSSAVTCPMKMILRKASSPATRLCVRQRRPVSSIPVALEKARSLASRPPASVSQAPPTLFPASR